jgi:regulator of RNase E activity RraA
MKVKPGDLIHADRHGAVVIPRETALALPEAIALCIRREKPILEAARGAHFSIDHLKAAYAEAEDIH